MSKINKQFVKEGKTSRDYVLSVPTYATLTERMAYVDAALIAGLKPQRVISDSSATAMTPVELVLTDTMRLGSSAASELWLVGEGRAL